MPALVTIPNVPIVSVGEDWPAMTGPVTFTRADLLSAVAAADDPHVSSPRLKLTAVHDTHGTPITEPAFGRVTNMRFDEKEQTIYGDYEGVPEWLAEILPAAYPNRSVEMWSSIKTPKGVHQAVIGAVQLLGVEWPGCTVLEDLPLMFGKTQPKTVVVNLGGAPMAKLSMAVEDVRRAYYDQLDSQGNFSWWVKSVMLEPNQLVVEDEWESELYLVDFEIDGEEVTFQDPQSVKIQYVPTEAAAKASFVHAVATGMEVGRRVAASYRSPQDAGRVIKASKGGEGMTEEQRKAAAAKLGLPEDATAEQINQKLLDNALGDDAAKDDTKAGEVKTETLNVGGVEIPAVPPAGTIQHDGGAAPAPVGTPATQMPVAASNGLTVNMDRGAHDQLVADAALGRQARQDQVKTLASQRVEEAVNDGRIAPASRASWMSAVYDEKNCRLVDSELAVLAGLAKGRIPVDERGTGGGGSDDPGQAQLAATGGEAYPPSWFPEVASRRSQLQRQQAAGLRVFTEQV